MEKYVIQKFVMVFFSALLVVCSANADTVSFSTTTPIPATSTDWTNTLSFQQFDSSLGELTMVQLNLSGLMTTVLDITNGPTATSFGHIDIYFQITVQDSGLNLNTPSIDVTVPRYDYFLAPHESVNSGQLNSVLSSSDQYSSAAVLSEFTGLGTILLDAGTLTETAIFNTGGNIQVVQTTFAELTGTVIYTYNPAPEPASIILFGIGGVGFLIKRKQ